MSEGEEEELRALAKEVVRELVAMPCCSTFLEELIAEVKGASSRSKR